MDKILTCRAENVNLRLWYNPLTLMLFVTLAVRWQADLPITGGGRR